MTQYWEPGTAYNHGDIVEYEGHRYKIIQPHTSQSDWAPTVTPALWGRLSDQDHNQGQQQWQQPPPQQWQQQGNPNECRPDEKQQHYNAPPPQQPASTEQERKTHWYDLDDDRKKKLEIGGGLLGGIALLGAGYYAYSEHEKSEEEKKAQTWALTNWLHDAEQRTNDFHRNGPRGPATWLLNKGKNIPQSAISVGREKEWTLYICRAFHEGGVQIGKASDVFKKGAVIGYAHKEIHLDTYEILVGDMRGLRWVDVSGKLDVNGLGARPVDGGREADGTPLFIAAAPYDGAVHPGKASSKLDGALIPYDGTEKRVNNYRVLCYA
ncbi:carbohydrate-binding module family 12 protein [Hymenopellis radicata]|nr:carbohydrate-binding module family 12 protein [Hymenopellis radicata]